MTIFTLITRKNGYKHNTLLWIVVGRHMYDFECTPCREGRCYGLYLLHNVCPMKTQHMRMHQEELTAGYR